MKITRVEVYQLPIELKEPFIISLGPLTHANNLIVKLTSDSGLKGFGENSPFPTINGETMETGFVVAKYLAKSILGIEFKQAETCIQKMDHVLYGNQSIKSAFDMALYDILAQEAAMPLYRYLGGKVQHVLQTDYTISLASTEKMVADALWVIDRGFEIVKIKLGGKPSEDIERVKAIRAAIGNRIPIRLDANQGWDKADVPAILEALKDQQIQHCEEPILREYYMDLPALSLSSPIPIMADESCCDMYDAERLLKMHAVPMWNIKLGKSGGIYMAKKMLSLAEKHHIKVQIGGFLESRLGFTAAAHLAMCSTAVAFIDFDTPLMFQQDVVSGGIVYGNKGTIYTPETSGLGASIPQDVLDSLVQNKWVA